MNKNILDITIIPECPHKNCGQIFNESNLRLAIYLNGIFFLVKPEKGIIGFTCSQCQRTVTSSASYNDILRIKDILSNSPVEVVSYSESEDGKMLVNPKSSFDPSLNYLSPFMLSAEVINELDIDYFQSSNENDKVFSDQIIDHVEKNPELKEKYCSFAGDANNPISAFRTVYWFDDFSVEACLNYENENNVRIFPRYHYRTELVEQINSLLGINYFMGKTFEQAKEDHEREHAQTIEHLTNVAYENNLNFEKLLDEINISKHPPLTHIIEQNQNRVANDPAIPAGFLNVLTSNPYPLGNFLNAGICNYLWAEINPFENRPFPEFFIDEIDDPDLVVKIHEKNEEHITMAKRVQENSFKQYTQEFLRENVIDFLEEYEELITGNKFSYASVWELKESYLEGLYKTTNKGLSTEAPYVMSREGKNSWRMVFNNIKVEELLSGVGFAYIYYLLNNENDYYYHSDLILEGKGNESRERKNKVKKKGGVYKQDDGEAEFYDDVSSDTTSKSESPEKRREQQEPYYKLKKAIKEHEIKLLDAKKLGQDEKISQLTEKLKTLKKYKNETFDPRTKLPREITNQKIKNKKDIDSVGKAIKRAFKQLEKKHPEAYQYLYKALDGDHIYRDSLSYNPSPEHRVDWVLA